MLAHAERASEAAVVRPDVSSAKLPIFTICLVNVQPGRVQSNCWIVQHGYDIHADKGDGESSTVNIWFSTAASGEMQTMVTMEMSCIRIHVRAEFLDVYSESKSRGSDFVSY